MLDKERKSAEMKAASLASERQSALLAKEELARLAESQQKSKEQLVSVRTPFEWSCVLSHDVGEHPTCGRSRSELGICAAGLVTVTASLCVRLKSASHLSCAGEACVTPAALRKSSAVVVSVGRAGRVHVQDRLARG